MARLISRQSAARLEAARLTFLIERAETSFRIVRIPTDIFPNIDIPMVSIIWNYNRLVPRDINDRIVYVTERALTTTLDNMHRANARTSMLFFALLFKRIS